MLSLSTDPGQGPARKAAENIADMVPVLAGLMSKAVKSLRHWGHRKQDAGKEGLGFFFFSISIRPTFSFRMSATIVCLRWLETHSAVRTFKIYLLALKKMKTFKHPEKHKETEQISMFSPLRFNKREHRAML